MRTVCGFCRLVYIVVLLMLANGIFLFSWSIFIVQFHVHDQPGSQGLSYLRSGERLGKRLVDISKKSQEKLQHLT